MCYIPKHSASVITREHHMSVAALALDLGAIQHDAAQRYYTDSNVFVFESAVRMTFSVQFASDA